MLGHCNIANKPTLSIPDYMPGLELTPLRLHNPLARPYFFPSGCRGISFRSTISSTNTGKSCVENSLPIILRYLNPMKTSISFYCYGQICLPSNSAEYLPSYLRDRFKCHIPKFLASISTNIRNHVLA